jgi:hypothetical protein
VVNENAAEIMAELDSGNISRGPTTPANSNNDNENTRMSTRSPLLMVLDILSPLFD